MCVFAKSLLLLLLLFMATMSSMDWMGWMGWMGWMDRMAGNNWLVGTELKVLRAQTFANKLVAVA